MIYTVERARDQEKYSLDVSFLYLSEEKRELTCFPRFPAFLEKRSRQKKTRISNYFQCLSFVLCWALKRCSSTTVKSILLTLNRIQSAKTTLSLQTLVWYFRQLFVSKIHDILYWYQWLNFPSLPKSILKERDQGAVYSDCVKCCFTWNCWIFP